MNTTQSRTFDDMTRDDRWAGFGYLGERRNALESTDPEVPAPPELVQAADRLILDHAAASGWTDEQLFTWANSKNGRWYGDTMFGGTGTAEERFRQAARWGLLTFPR
jgi:hypothetical protein